MQYHATSTAPAPVTAICYDGRVMDKSSPYHGVECIVSGGQTGVDRAALDAAQELDLPHGGWCPRGRLAEDGVIPDCYHLTETESADYPVRTERNVLDSDGTLIIYRRRLMGGTDLTRRLAVKHRKPCCLVDLGQDTGTERVRRWLARHRIRVLNVAGPRESTAPGLGPAAVQFLTDLLADRRTRSPAGTRSREPRA